MASADSGTLQVEVKLGSETLQLMKSMAQAVLDNDFVAARALADGLKEALEPMASEMLPPQRITAPFERLRAVFYFDAEAKLDPYQIQQTFNKWLLEGSTLALVDCKRLELYELSEEAYASIQKTLRARDGA